MATGWEVAGETPAGGDSGWNVVGEAPSGPPRLSAGRSALGLLGGAANAVNNVPYAAVHGANDIARRLGLPVGTDLENKLHVAPLPETAGVAQDIAAMPGVRQTIGGVNAADAALERASPTAHDVLGHTTQVLQDVAGIAPVAGAARALPGATSAVADALSTRPGPSASVAEQAGLRSAGASPVARAVAGESGKNALTIQSQEVGNRIAANEAGHTAPAPLTHAALATAREPASAVYNRVAAALPEGALDNVSQQNIATAGQPGGTLKNSVKAQTEIDAAKLQLMDATTGQQHVQNLRALRQQGYANVASEDVDAQALGRAQLDMARAVEGHIERNLPADADVSAAQFRDARTALAKNFTVEGALRGNDVDLQALARVARADPGVMTGGLHTLADFAEKNPAITGLGSRIYQPPSYLNDVLGKGLTEPEGLLSPGKWAGILGGRMAARRVLTGSPSSALESANRMFPAQPASRFGPLQPPPAPPGTVPWQPPAGPAPLTLADELGAGGPRGAPQAPAGAIPHADLLSHGVEQPAAPGLSLATELGAGGPHPAPQGIPFRPNLEHAAGGLQTAPEDSWFKGGAPSDLGDLAHVMSQGVPEGIMARAQQPVRVRAMQFPGGQPTSMLANNASGESAASLEAISRGTRNVVSYNGDTTAPIMRDVTQIDRNAPKGSIHIDADTGEIVSRGSNLSQRQAEALRNRWASEHRKVPLGDALTTE